VKYLFFSLRPKQWIKNFFIFLPLVFGGKLFDFKIWMAVISGFFVFSMASSCAYVVNDLLDLENDKLHPAKRLRPIASGKVKKSQALILLSLLGIVSCVLSFILDIRFGWLIIIYLALNLIYSKFLKNAIIIDVFCIGAFFLLRIATGSIMAEVELSNWIIFMVSLLALFLGFIKRRQEIRLLGNKAISHRHVLKRYNRYFIDQIVGVVTASIVVAYMLYTVDPNTISSCGSTHLTYTIPFVYYGIFRYLYLSHKFPKEGDPTRILLFDKKLQLNLILWVVVCVAVIYFGI
jgi:4-hydroxybenzoate polyprenyltransferase